MERPQIPSIKARAMVLSELLWILRFLLSGVTDASVDAGVWGGSHGGKACGAAGILVVIQEATGPARALVERRDAVYFSLHLQAGRDAWHSVRSEC